MSNSYKLYRVIQITLFQLPNTLSKLHSLNLTNPVFFNLQNYFYFLLLLYSLILYLLSLSNYVKSVK